MGLHQAWKSLYVSVHIPTPYNKLQCKNLFSHGAGTVKLCCEEVLTHVLRAIQLCPYSAFPVTVVPKLQQVCLILEQQHIGETVLLYAFGARLISDYSRPFALCSFTPHRFVLSMMPVVMSPIISVCILLPFIHTSQFNLTGS